MPLVYWLSCDATWKWFVRIFHSRFGHIRSKWMNGYRRIACRKGNLRQKMWKWRSFLFKLNRWHVGVVRVGCGYSSRSPAIRKTMILFLFGVVYSILPLTSAILIVIIITGCLRAAPRLSFVLCVHIVPRQHYKLFILPSLSFPPSVSVAQSIPVNLTVSLFGAHRHFHNAPKTRTQHHLANFLLLFLALAMKIFIYFWQ